MKNLFPMIVSLAALASAHADTLGIGSGINSFGLDLHRRLAAEGGNVVTSPWSISSALAMTYGGASGGTREEMRTVLHLPAEGVPEGFAAIRLDLEELAQRSQARADEVKRFGGVSTPMVIQTANRLFGDERYPFEKAFLALTRDSYGAPLEVVNFRKASEEARGSINGWVASRTKDRIRELIPAGAVDADTRLVLANAIYLKAAWESEFRDEPDAPFFAGGREAVKVPGLMREGQFGYQIVPGGAAVTIPYAGGGLHFVLFIPDEREGLTALEKQLTPELLSAISQTARREITLHFPRFKLEPGRVMLAKNLSAMGMPSAFDVPRGSADFSGIARRQPNDYLYISQVIHQAFIAVDKHGTEAAAATAVVMPRSTSMPAKKPEPLVIRVDRPFAFAIQHQGSAACLFLGRVTDPR